jgi:hypothetical protein
MSSTLGRVLKWLRGPRRDGARDGQSLSVCGACRSKMANPVDWSAVDDARWWIRLRCGECAWSREVTVTNEAAERLERDLEPGLREIAAAAARLDHKRMTHEVNVFVAGLEHDLIDADDFARRTKP